MIILEEIHTAIEKLTAERDERGYVEMNGWLAAERGGASGAIDDPGYEGITNDPLIVTLYRTIDAQLGILQEAATQLTDTYGGAQLGPEFYRTELALARAINGEASRAEKIPSPHMKEAAL
jgi:hypothetical protein